MTGPEIHLSLAMIAARALPATITKQQHLDTEVTEGTEVERDPLPFSTSKA